MFYFGNAVGEAGNSPTDAMVNTADEIIARNARRGLADLAEIDNLHDFNRDRLVNVADRISVRNNQASAGDPLFLITPPAADAVAASLEASQPEAASEQTAPTPEWLEALDLSVLDASTGSSDSLPEKRSIELAIDRLLAEFSP